MMMTMMDDDDDRNGDFTKSSRILPDSLRKAVVTGLSAVFMTEEGIRNLLGDMRLPKDAMAYLMQQTERSRRELSRMVSDEIKGFLKGIDLTGEVRRALTGLRLEVKAEVRFVDDGTAKSAVSTTVHHADEAHPNSSADERDVPETDTP